MAKVTLDTILSGFKSVTKFITNFTTIQIELNDKVLYRDNPAGEANEMKNDLDMNSNDVLNADNITTTSLSINGVQVTSPAIVTAPTASQVANVPAGNIAATTVQAAVDELDTEKQAVNAGLNSISGLSPVLASNMLYTTGTDTWAVASITSFARTLLDDPAASTARTTLGLGTAATQGDASTSAKGVVELATTAEAEAGTDTTRALTASSINQMTAKAWVNFDGTGTVTIRDDFNVTSITDNGVGDYTINFTATMANANYSVVCSSGVASTQTGTIEIYVNTDSPSPSTTAVDILARRSTATIETVNTDNDTNFVAIFGD